MTGVLLRDHVKMHTGTDTEGESHVVTDHSDVSTGQGRPRTIASPQRLGKLQEARFFCRAPQRS